MFTFTAHNLTSTLHLSSRDCVIVNKIHYKVTITHSLELKSKVDVKLWAVNVNMMQINHNMCQFYYFVLVQYSSNFKT